MCATLWIGYKKASTALHAKVVRRTVENEALNEITSCAIEKGMSSHMIRCETTDEKEITFEKKNNETKSTRCITGRVCWTLQGVQNFTPNKCQCFVKKRLVCNDYRVERILLITGGGWQCKLFLCFCVTQWVEGGECKCIFISFEIIEILGRNCDSSQWWRFITPEI